MGVLPPAIPDCSPLPPRLFLLPDVYSPFTELEHQRMKPIRGHFFRNPPDGQVALWEK